MDNTLTFLYHYFTHMKSKELGADKQGIMFLYEI